MIRKVNKSALKRIISVLALCVLATSVWAQGTKTVRVQWIGDFKMENSMDPKSGLERKGLVVIKNEFERLNPGVKLEFIIMGWDDYVKKTQAMAMANEADVFQVPGIAMMVGQGVLENLEPFIKKDKFDTNIYLPGQIDGWKVQGLKDKASTIYSLPFIGDTRVITFDKKLFDDWGVAYLPKEPTLEQVVEAAKKMTGINPKTGKQNYGIAWKGSDSGDTVMNLNEYYGGQWGSGMRFNELKYEFDSPTMVKSVEVLKELTKYAPAGVMANNGYEKFSSADNDVAIHLRTTQEYYRDSVKLGQGDRYAISLLFINKKAGMGGMFAGSPYAIGSASKVKNEAWAFIKFTSSDFFQKYLFTEWNMLPVVRSAKEWPEIKGNQNMAAVIESLGRLWTPRYPYRAAAPRGFLSAAVEAGVSGKSSVKDALVKAQQEAVAWSSQQ